MFDAQIHLGDIILALIGLIFIPGVKSIYASVSKLRDEVRDLVSAVGQENPPTGLHLKVHNIETSMERRRYIRDK